LINRPVVESATRSVQAIDEPLRGTVSDQPGPGRVRRSHSDELCFENLVSNFTNTLEAASKVLSALLKNPGGSECMQKEGRIGVALV
jgi:hypothetical protein